MSYVAEALAIEDRALRSVRIIAAMPKEIAIEILERTEIARCQIDSARKAARR
jgi:hypothetical protein